MGHATSQAVSQILFLKSEKNAAFCLLFCYMRGHWVASWWLQSWSPLTVSSEVTYSEQTVSLLKAVQSGKRLQMQSWHGLYHSAEYHYFELNFHLIKLIDVDIFGKCFFGLAVPPMPQCLTNMINYYSLENLQNMKPYYENNYDNNKTHRNHQCYASYFPISPVSVFRENEWRGHFWQILHNNSFPDLIPIYPNSGRNFFFSWYVAFLQL